MSARDGSKVGRNSTHAKTLKPQCSKDKADFSGGAAHIVDKNTIPNSQKETKKNRSKKRWPSDATRSDRRRIQELTRAAAFGAGNGLMLSHMVTISWSACAAEETVGDAPWLALDEPERTAVITRGFRRLAKRLGFEVAYISAQAIGERFGLHIHIGIHWSHWFEEALIEFIEAGTGALRDMRANEMRSELGGWKIDVNYRGAAGAIGMAKYIAMQHVKRPDLQRGVQGRAFATSQNIGATAQRKAGWEPQPDGAQNESVMQ